MKKHIRIAALVMALALLLAGCGGNNSNNTSNNGFDRSAGLDENGYWKGVKASEYVEIPDFSKIEIKQSAVDEEKTWFLTNYPDTENVTDVAVKDNDTVNIDYVGKIDGVEFEGGSTGGQGTDVTIGVTSYIDGFLDQLIGHFPGETFDINVTFPDPYKNNTDLSGKPAVFTITINHIVKKIIGKWNDEFVSKNLTATYGWTTAAEAERAIYGQLAEEYMHDKSKFLKDIPDVIINYQIESALEYYRNYATAYGVDLETFISAYLSQTLDEFKADYKEQAKESAEFYLIYQAMAEKLGYTTSEADLKEYFKKVNTTADNPEDYSEFEQKFGLPYLKAMVMYDTMGEKLTDAVTVTN
ncbi:MAG: FKBP-type peptidyl-prolyl cis-trans isomerase [Firmicutes bacterium]|nr:FKBP-type peptidyl-prolyl cis-trans isomerase [Bacillota bacterium]